MLATYRRMMALLETADEVLEVTSCSASVPAQRMTGAAITQRKDSRHRSSSKPSMMPLIWTARSFDDAQGARVGSCGSYVWLNGRQRCAPQSPNRHQRRKLQRRRSSARRRGCRATQCAADPHPKQAKKLHHASAWSSPAPVAFAMASLRVQNRRKIALRA